MVETQFKWDKFAIKSDKYLKGLFIMMQKDKERQK